MNTLSDRAQKIGDVISVIDDIADQTNSLQLLVTKFKLKEESDDGFESPEILSQNISLNDGDDHLSMTSTKPVTKAAIHQMYAKREYKWRLLNISASAPFVKRNRQIRTVSITMANKAEYPMKP